MLQIIVIAVLVAADQLTKLLLWSKDALYQPAPVIPGVLNVTPIKNDGASFGMLQGAQPFFIVMTLIVLFAVGYYMIRRRRTQPVFLRVVLAVLFAGALGNLIDRIAFGYVRDFIDFCAFDFWKWVFNIADASLVIGAILLAVYLLFLHKDKKAEEKTEKDGAESESAAEDSREAGGGEKSENSDG